MSNSRVPIERARELGAQHGKEAGEAWIRSRNSLFNVIPIRLPEPELRGTDKLRAFGTEIGAFHAVADYSGGEEVLFQAARCYDGAFRAARDEVIRSRCEP